MSKEEIEYNSSSNISSNYQSPKNTSTKNSTISPSINPYIIYTKTLLHILSENKKSYTMIIIKK